MRKLYLLALPWFFAFTAPTFAAEIPFYCKSEDVVVGLIRAWQSNAELAHQASREYEHTGMCVYVKGNDGHIHVDVAHYGGRYQIGTEIVVVIEFQKDGETFYAMSDGRDPKDETF